MDRTADLDSALSFVIGRIAEQAKLSGEPLSVVHPSELNIWGLGKLYSFPS